MEKLKLAIVGCGAIAKGIHLPVAALSDQVELTALVDKFLPHARELADKYDVPTVVDDYREIMGKADAAILALPNYLHAPVAIDLLQRGVHVFVEKPMALKSSECDEMIKAAGATGAILAVGQIRRFFAASQFVKRAIESQLLGNILSFDVREGIIYTWTVTSALMFRKETAGGGVLTDIGVHALDLLLWWLGDYDSVEYHDDAMGGVEANCKLNLQLKCGASGIVELSRVRNLRNSCVIRGERGTLEIERGFNPLVHLKIKNQDVGFTGQVTREGVADKSLRDAFRRQLDDFVDAIRSDRAPFVPGQEGRRAVELIETCYASRQLLEQPWLFPEKLGHDVLEGVLP